jgi:hypothetical protein
LTGFPSLPGADLCSPNSSAIHHHPIELALPSHPRPAANRAIGPYDRGGVRSASEVDSELTLRVLHRGIGTSVQSTGDQGLCGPGTTLSNRFDPFDVLTPNEAYKIAATSMPTGRAEANQLDGVGTFGTGSTPETVAQSPWGLSNDG